MNIRLTVATVYLEGIESQVNLMFLFGQVATMTTKAEGPTLVFKLPFESKLTTNFPVAATVTCVHRRKFAGEMVAPSVNINEV